MTEKQKFLDYLKNTRNFMGEHLLSHSIVPHCYKTPEGNIILLSSIRVCMFQGSNSEAGDIGCLTIYYSGSEREKYHKTITHGAEIFKMVKCPKDADEAIDVYDQWLNYSNELMSRCKLII